MACSTCPWMKHLGHNKDEPIGQAMAGLGIKSLGNLEINAMELDIEVVVRSRNQNELL